MKNAADETQVRQAAEKEKRGRERELSDIAAVLNMPEGRRVFKRLFEVCGVAGSVWHSSALIHYRSGAQDVGHYFIKDMLEASPAVGTVLLAEAYAEKKGQQTE